MDHRDPQSINNNNNLKLNDTNGFRGDETKCDMFGAHKEDLRHFLLWCPAYCEERGKITRLQQPYKKDEQDIIGNCLFEKRNIEETKKEIFRFWMIEEERRERGEWTQTEEDQGTHQGVPLQRQDSRVPTYYYYYYYYYHL